MSSVIYRSLWLSYGLLNPAYLSYKTMKEKRIKDYVRLMMYWIVFALYSFVEVFADFFLSWLPFYWETKIVFLVWLSLPLTRGSTLLYTKFIHPLFLKREREIDKYLDRMRALVYDVLMLLGSKGFNMIAGLLVTGHKKLGNHLSGLSLTDLNFEEALFVQTQNSPQTMEEYTGNKNVMRRMLVKSYTIADPSAYEAEQIQQNSWSVTDVCSEHRPLMKQVFIEYDTLSQSNTSLQLTHLMAHAPPTPLPRVIPTLSLAGDDQSLLIAATVEPAESSKTDSGHESSPAIECLSAPPDEVTWHGECHSEFDVTPPSTVPPHPIPMPSKPKARSSAFTKSNFLRSMNFFDKASKASNIMNLTKHE